MSGLLWDIYDYIEAQNDEYNQVAKRIEKNIGPFFSEQNLGDKEDEIKDFVYAKISDIEETIFILGMKFGIRLMVEAMERYTEI